MESSGRLKGLVAASSAMFVPQQAKAGARPPEPQVEIQITPVCTFTFRLSILPANHGSVGDIPLDGSLASKSWGSPIAKLRAAPTGTISAGKSPAENFLPARGHRGCEPTGRRPSVGLGPERGYFFLSPGEFAIIRFRRGRPTV